MLESTIMAYSGSQLKKIREERNISLEQVASATRIRLAILQDLEDEEYSELSSSTQTKGFLKLYSDFLGLKEEETPEIQAPTPIPAQPIDKEEPVKEESNQKKEAIAKPAWRPETLQVEKPIIPAPEADDTVVAEALAGPKAKESEPASESQKELQALGRELAARRRYLNISWDVLEEETHIPKEQLRSLERGDLDAFINPMQFKGLLQAYARFLNLDLAAVMIRYTDAIQLRRLERKPSKSRRLKPVQVLPPFVVNLKRFFTLDLFFGTLMILGILAFLIWGISQMSFSNEGEESTATLPAVADILLSEPTSEFVATVASTEIAEEIQTILTSTPFYTVSETDATLEIVLLVRQNIWLKITSDGDVVFQGRQPAGNVLTYTGEESLQLETGNISAIEIIFNQEPLEPLSEEMGRAAKLLFSEEGMTELPIVELEPESEGN